VTPRASVIVPIHNKPTTLPLTIDTVLRQSEPRLEVLLVGDGVTDEVRDVVAKLVAEDERVRFLDFPKGPHHGERYRHDAIEAAESDAIFYLCDDDLLLPDHVADLLALLADHNVVQSRNGWMTAAGEVRFYAAELADPDSVALHLRDDLRFNSISITGTAHSRALYRAVDDPWDTTPAGQWPDHHQFRKLLRHPDFRGATSRRMTALQFPTTVDGRDTWTDEQRLAELRPWHRLVTEPGGQDAVDRLARQGELAQLVEDRATIALLSRDLEALIAHSEREAETESRLRAHVVDAEARAAEGKRLSAERLLLAQERLAIIEGLEQRVRDLNARIVRKDEALRRLRAERKPPP
jgi:glycosyltransferase involved in cell wall biosynthesis